MPKKKMRGGQKTPRQTTKGPTRHQLSMERYQKKHTAGTQEFKQRVKSAQARMSPDELRQQYLDFLWKERFGSKKETGNFHFSIGSIGPIRYNGSRVWFAKLKTYNMCYKARQIYDELRKRFGDALVGVNSKNRGVRKNVYHIAARPTIFPTFNKVVTAKRNVWQTAINKAIKQNASQYRARYS